jgi:hypothetical protein
MSLVYTLKCGNLKGMAIDLTGESQEVKNLFHEAEKRFQANVDWMTFDYWAFGPKSLLYKNMKSVNSSIYKVLKDMWLRLGKQQGKVK